MRASPEELGTDLYNTAHQNKQEDAKLWNASYLFPFPANAHYAAPENSSCRQVTTEHPVDEPSQGIKHCLVKPISSSIIWD
ncbi:hypothetical protein llap_11661 [Limosa lapponica baueri]|uniref:Uncharacterized protein n=1 Tax=Limosa lapponica baueri TaxID=1758121 RepID=A0A2I0TW60_LIMLA|nr:hypothetical protein llap_11661 [Limosa lapponica baueri]